MAARVVDRAGRATRAARARLRPPLAQQRAPHVKRVPVELGPPPDDEPPDEQQNPAPGGRLIELDDFLALDIPEYDWIVQELIERRDRVIITGPEGGGKSTLIRQMAVQCASGIHPFGGEPFPPLRVFLLDLENSTRRCQPVEAIELARRSAKTSAGVR